MRMTKKERILLLAVLAIFLFPSLLFTYLFLHIILGFAHYISIFFVFIVTLLFRRKKKPWLTSFGWGIFSGILVIIIAIIFCRHIIYENTVLRYLFPETNYSNAKITLKNDFSYMQGQEVIIPVRIQNLEYPVNIVSTILNYNPKEMQVLEVNEETSDFSIPVLNYLDNNKGIIKVVLGESNPGIVYDNARLFDIRVVFTKNDFVEIEVDPKSLILKNDGSGTNIRIQERDIFRYDADSNYGQLEYSSNQLFKTKSKDFKNPNPFRPNILTWTIEKIPENLAHIIYDSNEKIILKYSYFFNNN